MSAAAAGSGSDAAKPRKAKAPTDRSEWTANDYIAAASDTASASVSASEAASLPLLADALADSDGWVEMQEGPSGGGGRVRLRRERRGGAEQPTGQPAAPPPVLVPPAQSDATRQGRSHSSPVKSGSGGRAAPDEVAPDILGRAAAALESPGWRDRAKSLFAAADSVAAATPAACAAEDNDRGELAEDEASDAGDHDASASAAASTAAASSGRRRRARSVGETRAATSSVSGVGGGDETGVRRRRRDRAEAAAAAVEPAAQTHPNGRSAAQEAAPARPIEAARAASSSPRALLPSMLAASPRSVSPRDTMLFDATQARAHADTQAAVATAHAHATAAAAAATSDTDATPAATKLSLRNPSMAAAAAAAAYTDALEQAAVSGSADDAAFATRAGQLADMAAQLASESEKSEGGGSSVADGPRRFHDAVASCRGTAATASAAATATAATAAAEAALAVDAVEVVSNVASTEYYYDEIDSMLDNVFDEVASEQQAAPQAAPQVASPRLSAARPAAAQPNAAPLVAAQPALSVAAPAAMSFGVSRVMVPNAAARRCGPGGFVNYDIKGNGISRSTGAVGGGAGAWGAEPAAASSGAVAAGSADARASPDDATSGGGGSGSDRAPAEEDDDPLLGRKGALDDVLWPKMTHRRRRRRARRSADGGRSAGIEGAPAAAERDRYDEWHVASHIVVAEALAALDEDDCVELVRAALVPQSRPAAGTRPAAADDAAAAVAANGTGRGGVALPLPLPPEVELREITPRPKPPPAPPLSVGPSEESAASQQRQRRVEWLFSQLSEQDDADEHARIEAQERADRLAMALEQAAEADDGETAALAPHETSEAAAARQRREARAMLFEQARVGRLRSVVNIFMSALLDTEGSSEAGAATQHAVLHGMLFLASTEEGAATFVDVGVLESIFGLAYSPNHDTRLQATQLLLKLATAARAGVGAAGGTLEFLWSREGLRGLSTLLSHNLGATQQEVLGCGLRLLCQLLQAATPGIDKRQRLSTLQLGAQLDTIDHTSRAHAWRSEADAAPTADGAARTTTSAVAAAHDICRLLVEIRPLLAAAEAAPSGETDARGARGGVGSSSGPASPSKPKGEVPQRRLSWARALRNSVGFDRL